MMRTLLVFGMALGATTGTPAEEAEGPCLAPPTTVVRAFADPPESARLALTHCDGSPNLDALPALSTLARPKTSITPAGPKSRSAAKVASDGEAVDLLDPGLLVRLQAIATRFPGARIEIVSGHRPTARPTSRHSRGRALDLRVEGVTHEALSAFARTLPHTGVGYYPRSVFTHIDVRERTAYWVDRSRPGEKPDYGPWPPEAEATVLAQADTGTRVDPETRVDADAPPSAGEVDEDEHLDEASSAVAAATVNEAPEEEPSLSPADIRRIREETIATLERMLALDRRGALNVRAE